MEINHDIELHRAWIETEGSTAYVEYDLHHNGLDIKHTVVPPAIGGRGIASLLVKFIYDYAIHNGLTPIATCSYAQVWLKKHPEYTRIVDTLL